MAKCTILKNMNVTPNIDINQIRDISKDVSLKLKLTEEDKINLRNEELEKVANESHKRHLQSIQDEEDRKEDVIVGNTNYYLETIYRSIQSAAEKGYEELVKTIKISDNGEKIDSEVFIRLTKTLTDAGFDVKTGENCFKSISWLKINKKIDVNPNVKSNCEDQKDVEDLIIAKAKYMEFKRKYSWINILPCPDNYSASEILHLIKIYSEYVLQADELLKTDPPSNTDFNTSDNLSSEYLSIKSKYDKLKNDHPELNIPECPNYFTSSQILRKIDSYNNDLQQIEKNMKYTLRRCFKTTEDMNNFIYS